MGMNRRFEQTPLLRLRGKSGSVCSVLDSWKQTKRTLSRRAILQSRGFTHWGKRRDVSTPVRKYWSPTAHRIAPEPSFLLEDSSVRSRFIGVLATCLISASEP